MLNALKYPPISITWQRIEKQNHFTRHSVIYLSFSVFFSSFALMNFQSVRVFILHSFNKVPITQLTNFPYSRNEQTVSSNTRSVYAMFICSVLSFANLLCTYENKFMWHIIYLILLFSRFYSLDSTFL